MRITNNIISVCPNYNLKKVSKVGKITMQTKKEREGFNDENNKKQHKNFQQSLEKNIKQKNDKKDSPKVLMNKKIK